MEIRNLNLDNVLSETFSNVKDFDIKVYSEEEKVKLSDKVVTKLVNGILKKMNKDYRAVGKTKGDFTRLSNYKELGRAINYLKEEAKNKNSAELKRRVDVLAESYRIITEHKDCFTAAYTAGNDTLITVYVTYGTSIIRCTSEAISMATKISDDYKFGSKEHKSSSIDSLDEINRAARSGKIRTMCDNLVSRREGIVMAVAPPAAVLAIVILILKNVKVLVYNYYAMRVKMADHIRMISDYVAVKADRSMDSKVKAKQDKWVTRLSDLADKIDLDAKQGEADAKKSIDSSNAELDEIPSNWIF